MLPAGNERHGGAAGRQELQGLADSDFVRVNGPARQQVIVVADEVRSRSPGTCNLLRNHSEFRDDGLVLLLQGVEG